MMEAEENGDVIFDDEGRQLDPQPGNNEDHDQLPDVEEYKAIIGHRSGDPGGGFKSKVFKAIGKLGPSSASEIEEEGNFKLPSGSTKRKQDPPELIDQKYEFIDYEVAQQVENEGLFRNDMDDGQGCAFSTLEIEEKTGDSEDKEEHNGDISKCFWRSCAWVSLCLLASLLVLLFGFGVGPEMQPRDFFHFVRGDTDAYFAIRNYAVNIASISEEMAFGETTTPQYLASQWMAHGDPQNMPVPETKNLAYSERYIMAVLFFSLGGTEWTHQYNFLTGDHICTWFQEFNLLDDSTVLYGIHRCKEDSNGGLYPQSVFLPNNDLAGFIPPEVKGLERLEEFNVMFNPNIVGTIPAVLSSMDSLTHLGLQWCNFDGTIPSWIGSMGNLEYLGLGNNLLAGTVPSEIAKLERLELLGLDDNDLFGSIETFAPLRNLKSLYLENNFINGTISEDLMQGWPNLEELDLSECALSGFLPPTLFNQNPKLTVLDLHGNQFEGPFPSNINTDTALDFFAAHNNRLNGFIPASLTNLRALRHLDLSDNLFTGTIPKSIGEMTTLEYLFTGTNNFLEGEIPVFLIELTNLKELSMKQNKLQGTIFQNLSCTYQIWYSWICTTMT